jgi:hypothetical protein
MTALSVRLADWKRPEHWDEGHEVTEDEALEMVVFCAITDFIQEREDAVFDLLSRPESEGIDTDLGTLAAKWLDDYRE